MLNMKFFSKKLIKDLTFIFVTVLLLMVIVASQPSEEFPKGKFNFHIEKGDNVSYISSKLFNKKIIKSELLFKITILALGGDNGVFAGDYRFTEAQNTMRIAYRMVRGHQDQPKVKVVIPEGINVHDMAFVYLKNLSDFNAPRFVSLAKEYEGYLYPDTYYFLANAKHALALSTMSQ